MGGSNDKKNTAHISRGGGAESGPPPSLALGYDVLCRRFPDQEVEEGVEVEDRAADPQIEEGERAEAGGGG